jgi:biopolymer transport protein ExbB
MSLWDFVIKGGSVMVPIIIGSIVGLSLILERLYVLRKAKTDTGMLMLEIEQLIRRSEIQMAISACENKPGPVAAILKTGLRIYHDKGDEKDIDLGMQQEGVFQISKLERGLTGLGVVVTIEPMLGFLGTIVGLIKAFMNWETMGSNISINILAGGMYQAMITTAAGLIVAMPCYICYTWFTKKIQDFAKDMDMAHSKLIHLLNLSKKKVNEIIK